MDKYIGLDMDSKKIVACVVDASGRESYATLKPDLGNVRRFLEQQKTSGRPWILQGSSSDRTLVKNRAASRRQTDVPWTITSTNRSVGVNMRRFDLACPLGVRRSGLRRACVAHSRPPADPSDQAEDGYGGGVDTRKDMKKPRKKKQS